MSRDWMARLHHGTSWHNGCWSMGSSFLASDQRTNLSLRREKGAAIYLCYSRHILATHCSH